jgi:outer membrane assembly lipoprotein YfiO
MSTATGRATIFLLLLTSAATAQSRTWEQRGNQWVEVTPQQAATAPAADPTLQRAEQLLSEKKADRAKELALSWYKRNHDSALVDRALFIIARAENRVGDGIRAFYYYDQLLDEHPESPLYATTLQKQYDIADSYLRGRKRSFMGMYVLGAEEEAVEMLYRVQQRAPSSPMAEKSLLRNADYYFADRQYDLAQDAYGFFIRQYSRSPMISTARLKQAYSAYALFHGPRFEVTPIIDARQRLATLMAEYPNLAEQENLPAMVEQIDQAMARKIWITADFYRRTHEPRAAAYNYRYLVSAYPESKEAQQASAQLRKMPPGSLDIPEPKVQQDTPALRTTPDPMPKVK